MKEQGFLTFKVFEWTPTKSLQKNKNKQVKN